MRHNSRQEQRLRVLKIVRFDLQMHLRPRKCSEKDYTHNGAANYAPCKNSGSWNNHEDMASGVRCRVGALNILELHNEMVQTTGVPLSQWYLKSLPGMNKQISHRTITPHRLASVWSWCASEWSQRQVVSKTTLPAGQLFSRQSYCTRHNEAVDRRTYKLWLRFVSSAVLLWNCK